MLLEGSEIFHRREREFFSVSPFAPEGKTNEVKEFTIAERTVINSVKVFLLHFRLEYLEMCNRSHLIPSRCIWLNTFTGFNDGGS